MSRYTFSKRSIAIAPKPRIRPARTAKPPRRATSRAVSGARRLTRWAPIEVAPTATRTPAIVRSRLVAPDRSTRKKSMPAVATRRNLLPRAAHREEPVDGRAEEHDHDAEQALDRFTAD